MVGIVDIAFFIAGCITVVLSLSLLIITKDFKTVFIWSFFLTVVQIALAWTEHELKWHIVAVMVFFLFVLAIIQVKIKRRINAALKRIAQIEEEEKEKEREARKEKIRAGAEEMAELYRTDPQLKELNEFVGDYRDHDSV